MFVKERYGKASSQLLKDGAPVWREMSPAEKQVRRPARTHARTCLPFEFDVIS